MDNLIRGIYGVGCVALALGLLSPSAARAQGAGRSGRPTQEDVYDEETAETASRGIYEQATVEAAQEYFAHGLKEMQNGDYTAACASFEQAVIRVPDALGAEMALATCYEAQHRTASAWSQYASVATMATKAGRITRAKEAAKKAGELRPRLATLALEIPEDIRAVPGLVIKQDGVPLDKRQWGTAIPVDAGEHEVTAAAPGRRPWTRRVQVAADGQNVSIRVGPLPAQQETVVKKPPPASDRDSSGRGWQRPVGFASITIGGVSLLSGAVLGVVALAKKGESDADNHCDAQDRCDSVGMTLRDTSRKLGDASTAAFIVAGGLVAGGTALLLTSPRPSHEEHGRAPALRWRAGVELGLGSVQIKGAW